MVVVVMAAVALVVVGMEGAWGGESVVAMEGAMAAGA